MSEDNEWNDFESGPFCRHWADPTDCDVRCTCGHECHNHPYEGCNLCECESFEYDENQKYIDISEFERAKMKAAAPANDTSRDG